MKSIRNGLTLLFSVFVIGLFAQIQEPVKWKFYVDKEIGDEIVLKYEANIEAKWHLYSQFLEKEDGPIATEFAVDKSTNYSLIGKVEEGNPHKAFDNNFQMELAYFENKAIFTQSIKRLSQGAFSIKGSVYYMVCDDSRCLPPEEEFFEIKIPAKKVKESKKEIISVTKEDVGISGSFGDEGLANQFDTQSTSPGILEPVDYTHEAVKVSEGVYDLKVTFTIDEGWHVYDIEMPNGIAAIPTGLHFDESVSLEGKLKAEGELHTKYDEGFSADLSYYENTLTVLQRVNVGDASEVKAIVAYLACKEVCLPPVEEEIIFKLKDQPVITEGVESIGSDSNEDGKSYWTIFLVAFLAGLVALITPCVFPMIPLTVSFFTKQSENKAKGKFNAFLYGFFIILVYVILSLPFHIFDSVDPNILNSISTNVYLNIFFFIIFIVFALSFLGAFEISMPNSLINKADSASSSGGIIGIFFMALTLVLVSFSCTGPVLGGLLGSTLSTDGGAMALTIGMIGFGSGLALPFALFALFPSWLNSMPKSGGWLNNVKVVLGFLELALALKFLSNADLVLQAGWLKREIFLAIWIGVFFAMTMYLFGVFKTKHDSSTEGGLSTTRIFFALTCLIFTIYLLPGIWGAPLKLISGFPPPMSYSEFPNGSFQSGGNGGDTHSVSSLVGFHDYDKALAHAKSVGKPLFIDFTGYACVNCRRMEENVWVDHDVYNRLKNDFIVVSLYVDAKEELPKSEQKEVQIGSKRKKLRTVGNKWSYFQASKYGTNTQPYYVIVNHQENKVAAPTSYDTDIQKYINWLDLAKKNFENKVEFK